MARHALPGHFVIEQRKGDKGMTEPALVIGLAAALLDAQRLQQHDDGRQRGASAQTAEAAKEAAGDKTIAAGLDAEQPVHRTRPRRPGSTRRWPARAPTPCWCPTMPRSRKLPAGTFDAKPENRAQLTGVLTNMILPGHRARRRHRQGDRQRQGQGGAGDHGRRHADRDQGGRQDRPDRLPPATRRP